MVLGGLDTCVHRNYFGSQLGSFVADVQVRDDGRQAEYKTNHFIEP